MKKIYKISIIVLSLFLLVGCEAKTNEPKTTKEDNKVVENKLKEGKYTQIEPSNEGSQGEGYDNYLTLENGKVTEFNSYFEITTEGEYVVEGNILTITYTRTHGLTTYGEPFDDPVDQTLTCHIDGNKIIVDKMSDFDAYDTGSIIYELK